ncbi:fungal-specific transcription factor domain-containing protein [Usnea florida]
MSPAPGQSYPPPFRPPFQSTNAQEQNHSSNGSFEGKTSSSHEIHGQFDQTPTGSFSELSQGQNSHISDNSHRANSGAAERDGHSHRNSSLEGSEPTSPRGTRDYTTKRQSDWPASWTQRSSNENASHVEVKEEVDKKPHWSELKTKAGKERKRLPLACIACRRKKIRCSGEKPACKHCLRSRIPCVYKVTTRKAAPRTDYMAMLDKRLKRMEERVIKIIPKEESEAVPRAIIKPSAAAAAQANSGKKRSNDEAFGPQLDEWVNSKPTTQLSKGQGNHESSISTDGEEHLPAPELQNHLSEVFFDNLYGQSYHLLHKPSYMRRLRAGTLPPVLVLAVCAVSARFSSHPQVNTEPAFLRGESWARPARDIALRHYDEPNISILTVLLLLGLHEFGTCQGGRSWMLGGMATRMAYALQLHRELDHDPLGRKTENKSELSFTDREIRRRTMWACFLMDRFTSSGTERPMFADEDIIKVQLPVKESNFQMEIPGPTESLDGGVPNPVKSDTAQLADAQANMGVAAYMIRVIALWGRVIKYLNMGGKERDQYPIWDSKSQYAELRRQASDFKTLLPAELQNNHENLKNHAAEKLGNQFLFMHIASSQVVLFLHRFAIPTAPGGRNPEEMPKSFLAEAAPAALEAASQISVLINDAMEYHTVAPFLGYCAFVSSTIHVWGIFSKNKAIKASCKKHLASNVRYLGKMKKHWGMFHFMAENLNDIYRQHADASKKGSSELANQDDTIFQYGDWFQKYPHGVSETDYQDPPVQIKKEPNSDATLGHEKDLQSVEDFFHTQSSPSRLTQPRKSGKKNAKIASQQEDRLPQQQVQQPEFHANAMQHGMLPLPMSESPMDSSAFVGHQPQLYPQPCNNSFPQAYDLLPLPTPANTALLPQLDRHLVYGAYAGNDPTGSSSASALSALTNGLQDPQSNQQGLNDPATSMWDNPLDLSPQTQQQLLGSAGGYMGDLQTSAWFMPFNLNPPEIGGEGDETGSGLGGFGGGGL